MWSRITPYIWDGYQKGEVPSNLKLWAKVWQNLWENDHNHYHYRFEPISLRVVLKQIIDDVRLSIKTKHSPARIKDQLNHQMDYAKSFDSIAVEMLRLELAHLYKLVNKNDPDADEIIQLSSYLLNRLDNESYFEKIFLSLKERIFDAKEPTLQELKVISQLLIIEYVEKGFTLETVKEIPDNLFNKGQISYNKELPIFKGKYFGTDLPFEMNEESPITEKFDFFKVLYKAPRFQARAVFLVLGASVNENKATRIGDVEFHPPLALEAEGGEKKSLWVFNLLEEKEKNKPFLRASVVRMGIDCFKILSEGRREIEKAVDFLKYRYKTEHRAKITVSRSWALLNIEVGILHQMPDVWEGLPKHKPYYEGVDFISLHKDDVEFVEQQGKKYGLQYEVLSSNRIYQALHWVHKAQESKHVEDSFMAWWVALEYLVRTEDRVIDSIISFVPAISINEIFDEIQHNLHRLLQSQVSNGFLEITDEQLAAKYWLWRKIGRYSWSLKQFCEDLPPIAKFVEDRYVSKRIDEILQLSANKKDLLGLLQTTTERLKFELTTIYRIRNKIVHSAEYDHEYIIHYAIRLREIVDMILQNVLFYLQYYPDRSINDILLRLKVISEMYLQKVENDPDFDVYDYTFFG